MVCVDLLYSTIYTDYRVPRPPPRAFARTHRTSSVHASRSLSRPEPLAGRRLRVEETVEALRVDRRA